MSYREKDQQGCMLNGGVTGGIRAKETDKRKPYSEIEYDSNFKVYVWKIEIYKGNDCNAMCRDWRVREACGSPSCERVTFSKFCSLKLCVLRASLRRRIYLLFLVDQKDVSNKRALHLHPISCYSVFCPFIPSIFIWQAFRRVFLFFFPSGALRSFQVTLTQHLMEHFLSYESSTRPWSERISGLLAYFVPSLRTFFSAVKHSVFC